MQTNILKKLSLLGISIFLMSHLAISPSIPQLFEFYKANNNIGLASVESLATAPAAMITVFVLLSNFFIKFIGKKNTVLLGLALILLAGITPFFISNFKIVFISRLILGAGIGLFNSLSISLISDFYEKDERATMIGLRTSFLNIGKALTTFISGYFIIYGINYIFLVYLLVIPIFIMFLFFVPSIQGEENKKSDIQFNKVSISLTLLTFIVGIAYMGATIKIPTLLTNFYKLEADVSRNLLTVLAASGIISGFIFGKLIKTLKSLTLIVMLLSMALGNLVFALNVNNIFVFYIGAILIGLSFVGTMSFNFFYISQHVEKKYINFSTSLVLVGGNIGVILTPVVLTKLPEALNLNKFISPFYISTCLLIIAITITSAIFKLKHKS